MFFGFRIKYEYTYIVRIMNIRMVVDFFLIILVVFCFMFVFLLKIIYFINKSKNFSNFIIMYICF